MKNTEDFCVSHDYTSGSGGGGGGVGGGDGGGDDKLL